MTCDNLELFAPGPKERIAELADFISRCDHAYYILNKPFASDLEYDRAMKELEGLEAEYPEFRLGSSPTSRVSGEVQKIFGEVAHEYPMLSLANSYNIGDLYDFEARAMKDLAITDPLDLEYCVELKFDGLSISLVYERGELVRAATRGDGKNGEDVTRNARTIKQVPLKLSMDCDITVRGEVYMSSMVFERLNAEREEAGESVFANPRNAAAGSVRQLDPKITAGRELSVFLYSVAAPPLIREGGRAEQRAFATHSESLEFMRTLGFPVCENYAVLRGMAAVAEYIGSWSDRRHGLPYATDGMVVKINCLSLYERLGYTAKSPRFAVAYKFAPERAETVVESIDIQVGKMGTLTPVANLRPVTLAGTKVARASLHNAEEIAAKDIRVGDTVIVEKAGEIIPQVVEVVVSKRPTGAAPFEMPENCPACGSKVIKNEGEVALRCVSPLCRAQLIRKTEYFVSKHALDVEGFGTKIVESVVEHGLIEDMADVLKLSAADLMKLPRFAEKSAAKLAAEIEAKKKTSFARFITALQIPFVGETTAAALAKHFKTPERLMEASEEDYLKVNEIGEKIAASLRRCFDDGKVRGMVEKMMRYGVTLNSSTDAASVSEKFAGMTFVITGTLPVRREEAEKLIESNGGHCSSSISKKTAFLVCGEEAGSKLEKAEKLGVRVIDYEELLKMATE